MLCTICCLEDASPAAVEGGVRTLQVVVIQYAAGRLDLGPGV